MDDKTIIRSVRRWLESLVVARNLCPFAKRELVNDRVRFVVTRTAAETQLLQVLQDELQRLNGSAAIETTLLIHPDVLRNFYDYNQFLEDCDRLLVRMNLDGVFQVASFHPDYQFSGTEPDDAENFSNRSPYPLLHILRESSVERAVASHADIEQIPRSNIEALNRVGTDELLAEWQRCFDG